MFDDQYSIPPNQTAPDDADPVESVITCIPRDPCEGCRWHQAFAEQYLACRVFLHFAHKGIVVGGPRRPNRNTYRRLFGLPPEFGNPPEHSGDSLDWIDDLLPP